MLNLNHKKIIILKEAKFSIIPARSIIEFRLNYCKCYEPQLMSFLDELHLRNVIDIGANIGIFTVLFGQKVGETGKVISFEPNPENYIALTKNVKLNKLKNIVMERMAISNNNGLVKMGLNKNNALHSFIYSSGENTFDAYSIKLDDYLKKNCFFPIDLIKIDIEGAEMLALEGMSETLQNNLDIILLIEVHKKELLKIGSSVQRLFQFLKKRDFHVLNLYNNGKTEHISDNFQKVSTHIICSRRHFN